MSCFSADPLRSVFVVCIQHANSVSVVFSRTSVGLQLTSCPVAGSRRLSDDCTPLNPKVRAAVCLKNKRWIQVQFKKSSKQREFVNPQRFLLMQRKSRIYIQSWNRKISCRNIFLISYNFTESRAGLETREETLVCLTDVWSCLSFRWKRRRSR